MIKSDGVDTSGLLNLVKDFDKLSDATLEDIEQLMDVSLRIFETTVAYWTPVNFGTLRQSIQGTKTITPTSVDGLVTTNLAYGLPVERGRDPGRMPPVDAIELWVIRKGIAAAPESRGVAFAIAKAIAKGTTKFQQQGGARMFEQGFEQGQPLVDKQIEAMLDRLSKRLTDV